MTEQSFDSEVYLGRKRRERILSWGSMILGALILLDSGAPIPFPLVGLPSILVVWLWVLSVWHLSPVTTA